MGLGKPAARIGWAIALTAAVAFPAGIWVANLLRSSVANPDGLFQTPASSAAASPAPAASARNPYSANIRDDPYVVQQQRALVEAMERECRQLGTGCSEARGARRYIDARKTQ